MPREVPKYAAWWIRANVDLEMQCSRDDQDKLLYNFALYGH